MSKTDTLQELLTSGLLSGIGEDEFGFLKKAETDLASRFRKAPKEIITAVLVALDSEVPKDEVSLEIAEKHIVRYWKTFRGKYKNLPITILRALLLSAIIRASDNTEVAIATWYTSASVIPHIDLGRESTTIQKILLQLAEGVGRETSSANMGVENKISELIFEHGEQPSIPKVSKERHQNLVAWAAGPHDESGQPSYEGPNPHWPNAGQPWSFEFAKRMSAALAETQEKAANQAVKLIYDNFSKQTSTHFDKINQFIVGQETANTAQLNVLSWAYALYSKSLYKSYREISSSPLAALLMAYDLLLEAGAPCPPSVVYMLGESISRLCSDDKKPLKALVKEIEENKELIRNSIPEIKPSDGRIPLLLAVNAVIHGHNLNDYFTKKRLGFDPSTPISTSDFGMWCFRDLQAHIVTGRKK